VEHTGPLTAGDPARLAAQLMASRCTGPATASTGTSRRPATALPPARCPPGPHREATCPPRPARTEIASVHCSAAATACRTMVGSAEIGDTKARLPHHRVYRPPHRRGEHMRTRHRNILTSLTMAASGFTSPRRSGASES
jgi:hypothetical protein